MINSRLLKPLTRVVESAKFNWQTTVKGGRALGAGLLLVSHLRGNGLSRGYVGQTFQFAKRVVALHRHGSWAYVVRYLKACSVLLQQSASGQRIPSAQELGAAVARTRSGIPRIIHSEARKRIRSGGIWEIRFWLSLLGLYRVISIPGKLKLRSITDPATVTVRFQQDWVLWLSNFAPVLLERIGFSKESRQWIRYSGRSLRNEGALTLHGTILRDFIECLSALVYPKDWSGLPLNLKPRFRMFTTSGPGSANSQVTSGSPSRTNLGSLITDATQILAHETVGPSFQQWLVLVKDFYLTKVLAESARIYTSVLELWEADLEAPGFFNRKVVGRDRGNYYNNNNPEVPPQIRPILGFGTTSGLGKLGFKTEAAGKIRVFAMVDSLTQMLLGPLHDALFNMLRKIPQDGTFDQMSPANLLIQQGYRKFWSYDLSAATDRFPISLQQAVLGIIIGPKLAGLWVAILDRDFTVPQSIPGRNPGEKPTKVPKGTPKKVRYGAGQPMGALTSWAAFSLTHHILVQYAAFKAYGSYKWFTAYALLGDDIVLADKKVSEMYLKLLSEIGVEYGLAKSLISSTGGFEFAKRTFYHGQDVSGFPLLALGAAKADPSVLEELLTRAGVRGLKQALLTAARFLGYGYRSRAQLPVVFERRSRLQGLAIILSRPKGPYGSVSFSDWITKSNCGEPPIISPQMEMVLRDSVWSRLWEPMETAVLRLRDLLFVRPDLLVTRVEPNMAFDQNVEVTSVKPGTYQKFLMQRILGPYIDTEYKGLTALFADVEAVKPLAGPGSHIDDAWSMLTDLKDRASAYPKEPYIGIKPKLDFGAKRRSGAVRLWRAVRALLRDLATRAQDDLTGSRQPGE